MYLRRIYIYFGVLLFIVFNSYGVRLLWWTTGSSASSGESNTGTTVGQALIGRQYEGNSTYGFWWNQPEPVICIYIDEEYWYIDSVDVMETVTMLEEEKILVRNCGNCNQNYGLEFTGTSPLLWDIGYSIASNRFVARAKFIAGSGSPSGFDHTRDYIKDVVSWAHGTSFGEGGYDVPISSSRFLWLQFLSPRQSEVYGENTITITLYCQVNLH